MPNQLVIMDNNREDALALERLLRSKGVANPISTLTDGLVAMDYLLGKAPYGDRNLYPLPVGIFLEMALPGKTGATENPQLPTTTVVTPCASLNSMPG